MGAVAFYGLSSVQISLKELKNYFIKGVNMLKNTLKLA